MLHFCTYFDRNYLAQGLTLYRSLMEHAGPFTLWVLCFDDPARDVLSRLNLANLRPVSLQEFEKGDEALQNAKRNRSRVEYYFTCTPSWLLYLLGRHPEKLRHLEAAFGIYNVGLLTFGNDLRGKSCLQWWRDRCLEWCGDRPENGRFADQKYLDDWPGRFDGVVVLQHKGAGLAPWNHMNYMVRIQNGEIAVDGNPLIFYHFQGVRIINRRFFDPGAYRYGPMPLALRRRLYSSSVRSLFA